MSKIDVNSLSGTDKEKVAALLAEIRTVRIIQTDAAPEQREELQLEVMELIAYVNNLLNAGKTIIKTINNN